MNGLAGIGLCSRAFPTLPEDKILGPMSHFCYEGTCATARPDQQTFRSVRALRTHHNRCHNDILEGETSLGEARRLKRTHDAEDEARKRQRLELEAQVALEAENRELEPRPVS